MKKFRFLKMTFLMLMYNSISLAANAYTTNIDGINYSFNYGSDKTATVIAGNEPYSGDIVIPAIIDYQGTELTVTAIGDEAFYGCIQLSSITLPEGMETIGQKAFYQCSALHDIVFPESLKAIGNYAFAESGLQKVDFKGATIVLGDYAFHKCKSLENVAFPKKSVTFGEYCFAETALPKVEFSGYANLGSHSFYSCESLKEVQLSASTRVGEHAFSRSAVESIDFGDLDCLGDYAFSYCLRIKELDFDKTSISTIGEKCFQNCRNLRKVVLSPYITSMKSAFHGCNLEEVNFNGMTVVPEYAFSGIGIYGGLMKIPGTVTEIRGFAFDEARFNKIMFEAGDEQLVFSSSNIFSNAAVETVYLARSLKRYGAPFDGVESLKELVTLPGCRNIGTGYEGCSLEKVVIGSDLESLDYFVFWNCKNLRYLEIQPGNTTLGWTVIQNIKGGEHYQRAEYGNPLSGINLDELLIGRNLEYLDYYALNSSTLHSEDFEQHAFDNVKAKRVLFAEGMDLFDTDLSMLKGNVNGIEEVGLPASLTEIEAGLPAKVARYISKNPIPPQVIMESLINIDSDAVLVVPMGSAKAYAAAEGWRKFSHIEESSTLSVMTVDSEVNFEVVGRVLIAHKALEVYNLDGIFQARVAVGSNFEFEEPGIYVISSIHGSCKIFVK